MKALLTAVVFGAVLLAANTPLAAHDRYRIVGTVTRLTADEITVKQVKDAALVEMDHDKNTKVIRENKKAGKIGDVKVGSSVVIDALGDSILDLVVLEIRLVPAIPATRKPQ
jgi:hypothetical protein